MLFLLSPLRRALFLSFLALKKAKPLILEKQKLSSFIRMKYVGVCVLHP